MSLQIKLTEAGRTALINATAPGFEKVTISQAGLSQTGFTPTGLETSLPNEFKRLNTMAGDVIAPGYLAMQVRDMSTDEYTLRALGFYSDTGVLVFLCSHPSELILEKSSALKPFLDFSATIDDAELLDGIEFGDTNFLMPPATQYTEGLTRLGTKEEHEIATSDDISATPKGVAQRISYWWSNLNDERLTNARDWNAETVSKTDAEEGLSTTPRKWTAQRVHQAIEAIAKKYSFPSGTKMIFAQSAAPIGWVKDTTHNNKALRVVSGTTGGQGSGSISFSDAFSTSKAISVSVANHTLTTSQTPSHAHSVFNGDDVNQNFTSTNKYACANRNTGGNASYNIAGSTTVPSLGLTTSVGGGSAHNHSASGSVNFDVQKVDVIICTKE